MRARTIHARMVGASAALCGAVVSAALCSMVDYGSQEPLVVTCRRCKAQMKDLGLGAGPGGQQKEQDMTAIDDAIAQLQKEADNLDADLIERATAAYALHWLDSGLGAYFDEHSWPLGLAYPANTSVGVTVDGVTYAVLEKLNGTLAVFRLEEDGSLTWLDDWPEAVAD